MKAKIIATVLMASMLLGIMSGCGTNNKTEVVSQTQEETQVETDTETEVENVEENIIEEIEDVKEETIKEEILEEEIIEEFTYEVAMEKVTRLLNAYIDITNYDNDINYSCINRAEHSSVNDGFVIESLTSDGFSLNMNEEGSIDFKNALACHNVYFTYLYDYVNNNGAVYDFAEYISSHTLDELLYNHHEKDYIDNVISSDNYLYNEFTMFHAAKLVPWIVKYTHDNETFLELKDLVTEGFLVPEISGIPVAYQYDLYFGEDFSGLKVVFDADGNMLNIVDTYGTDDSVVKGLSADLEDYIYTF